MKKRLLILLALSAFIASSMTLVYRANSEYPDAIEYFKGHYHKDRVTHGAPEHSGGTNKQGCHNGSVPYHCH